MTVFLVLIVLPLVVFVLFVKFAIYVARQIGTGRRQR
jgi:hypothetical protein